MIKLKVIYDNSPFGVGYTAIMSDGSIFCFSASLNTPVGRGKYCGNVIDKNLENLFTFSNWREISMEDLPKKPGIFLQDILRDLNLNPIVEVLEQTAPLAPDEIGKDVPAEESFLIWRNGIRISEI